MVLPSAFQQLSLSTFTSEAGHGAKLGNDEKVLNEMGGVSRDNLNQIEDAWQRPQLCAMHTNKKGGCIVVARSGGTCMRLKIWGKSTLYNPRFFSFLP